MINLFLNRTHGIVILSDTGVKSRIGMVPACQLIMESLRMPTGWHEGWLKRDDGWPGKDEDQGKCQPGKHECQPRRDEGP